jgi:hypothetical protein
VNKGRVSIGATVAGVVTFLAHNFQLTGTTPLGAHILEVACAILAYVAGAWVHNKSVTPSSNGPTSIRGRGASTFLLMFAALAALTPRSGWAQTPDSMQRHRLELGSDVSMRSDSVTEPVRVRVGYGVDQRFTVEYAASAARSDEGYFEANVSLGVTAAVVPGSTRFDGPYLSPQLIYHYEGGPAQLGVGIEVGTRKQTGANMVARVFMFTRDYFATRRLPTVTSIGVGAGVSFGF